MGINIGEEDGPTVLYMQIKVTLRYSGDIVDHEEVPSPISKSMEMCKI